MEKSDFLANEMPHHCEWTERNIKYKIEDYYIKLLEQLAGGVVGPVGGLTRLIEENSKTINSLTTTAATQFATLTARLRGWASAATPMPSSGRLRSSLASSLAWPRSRASSRSCWTKSGVRSILYPPQPQPSPLPGPGPPLPPDPPPLRRRGKLS